MFNVYYETKLDAEKHKRWFNDPYHHKAYIERMKIRMIDIIKEDNLIRQDNPGTFNEIKRTNRISGIARRIYHILPLSQEDIVQILNENASKRRYNYNSKWKVIRTGEYIIFEHSEWPLECRSVSTEHEIQYDCSEWRDHNMIKKQIESLKESLYISRKLWEEMRKEVCREVSRREAEDYFTERKLHIEIEEIEEKLKTNNYGSSEQNQLLDEHTIISQTINIYKDRGPWYTHDYLKDEIEYMQETIGISKEQVEELLQKNTKGEIKDYLKKIISEKEEKEIKKKLKMTQTYSPSEIDALIDKLLNTLKKT